MPRPSDSAVEADRLARFQREAEVLSSINYPHGQTTETIQRSLTIRTGNRRDVSPRSRHDDDNLRGRRARRARPADRADADVVGAARHAGDA